MFISIHIRAIALCGLIFSGCTSSDGPTQKFVDGCREIPASCGGIYSPDGHYLAFLSSAGSDHPDQVYRLDLKAAEGRPELVSMSANGEIANGACHDISFTDDNAVLFACDASNLLPGTTGRASYLKRADDPLLLADAS